MHVGHAEIKFQKDSKSKKLNEIDKIWSSTFDENKKLTYQESVKHNNKSDFIINQGSC